MKEFDQVEILAIKLEELFPDAGEREKAASLLASYGSEEDEREAGRVRLAALKLAGSDLGKLQGFLQSAREDYRDVLAWAEYPNQNRIQCGLGSEGRAELIRRDREQYEQWLFGETKNEGE